jgi:hypothetical protein
MSRCSSTARKYAFGAALAVKNARLQICVIGIKATIVLRVTAQSTQIKLDLTHWKFAIFWASFIWIKIVDAGKLFPRCLTLVSSTSFLLALMKSSIKADVFSTGLSYTIKRVENRNIQQIELQRVGLPCRTMQLLAGSGRTQFLTRRGL